MCSFTGYINPAAASVFNYFVMNLSTQETVIKMMQLVLPEASAFVVIMRLSLVCLYALQSCQHGIIAACHYHALYANMWMFPTFELKILSFARFRLTLRK